MKMKSGCKDKSSETASKLWCICNAPQGNRFMVECTSCSNWYHGICVGFKSQISAERSPNWKCQSCIQLQKVVVAPLESLARNLMGNIESKFLGGSQYDVKHFNSLKHKLEDFAQLNKSLQEEVHMLKEMGAVEKLKFAQTEARCVSLEKTKLELIGKIHSLNEEVQTLKNEVHADNLRFAEEALEYNSLKKTHLELIAKNASLKRKLRNLNVSSKGSYGTLETKKGLQSKKSVGFQQLSSARGSISQQKRKSLSLKKSVTNLYVYFHV